MINIFALIPARSGSKGVPDKNIRKLGGHSLIKWAIKACQESKFINDIYMTTDSENYAQEAVLYGAKAPFLRPKNISGDFSTDYEMVLHALDWFKINKQKEPDIIVHIRPTTPLRDPSIIDQAIKIFLDQKGATSLRSVHIMSESAYKTFEISSNGNLIPIFSHRSDIDFQNNPRQMFPDTYAANGYVDIISCQHVKEFKSIHGNNVIPFLTERMVEVDCEDDFKYLNYLVKENPNLIKKVFK